MTLNWIIGNVCSLLAMVTDSISSTRKDAKAVLKVQNVSQLFYCVGTAVLGGYSGAVQNGVSILRNLAAIRNVKSKWVEGTLVALGVVLGIAWNNLGWMGLLPVVANLQYSIAVFRFQDNERALKFAFWISVGMFGLFNLAISNLVGVATNFFVFATTAVVLFGHKKQ